MAHIRTGHRVSLGVGAIALAALVFLFCISIVTAHAQNVSNLIQNSSLETGASGQPTSWIKDYWGSPTPTFAYPVAGHTGNGASITLSSNSNGDAHWQPIPTAVTPGSTYTYSTWYKSNTATEIDAELSGSGGAVSYIWIADIPSSGGIWKQTSVTFTIPAVMTNASVYQLIFNAGVLSIDDISLSNGTVVNPPPPTPPSPSPAPSPSPTPTPPPPNAFPTLTFSVTPQSISQGASATINWTSQNTTSCVASNGWTGTKPVSGSQAVSPVMTTTYSIVCNGVAGTISQAITVQVIAAPTPPPSPPPPTPPTPPTAGVFSEGMMTLSFDDSWVSQYTNALPILQASGIRGTFYLTTQPIIEGWSDFMTPSQVQIIAAQGHEIADHTITHPHLTQLSSSQIINEISSSKSYLQNLTGKSVTTIAYPYGEFNANVKTLVQQAGYTAARGVDEETQNTGSSDKYNLKSSCIELPTVFASVKTQIDKAITNKQWYILCIHDVKYYGDQYSITPALLQQIVNYIKQTGIKTTTVAEGRALMAN